MLIIALLFNFLLVVAESRRRYRGGGGRAAGVGQVTQKFGQGVASLLKDIKQGNWGEQEQHPEYDEKKGNRFVNERKYYDQIGNDTTFYVTVIIATLLIVAGIMYYIIKVMPQLEQKNVVQEMKKRNQERFKHYEAIKMISETGVHPDKAFGRLQKIKYK